MTTIVRTINGDQPLSDIESEIQGKEAGAREFKDSVPDLTTDPTSNSVTFEKRPPGTVLKRIRLTKKNDPVPQGTHQIWEGTMIVDSTAIDVVAYRPT